jgi:16S rRNA G527 N7-methylase RsmG
MLEAWQQRVAAQPPAHAPTTVAAPQVYDLAIARAVAETRVLSELCLPFVRVGGLWVAAKGPNPQVREEGRTLSVGQGGEETVIHSQAVCGARPAHAIALAHAHACARCRGG